MIKVLVVDDQKLLAESFKNIIELDPEIEVVGCAANGLEGFDKAKEFMPDLVLMDIRMPVCDGIEATRKIKSEYPSIKVLILTTFEDDQNVFEALKNGADGYILKEITPEDLIQAVKNTSKGFGIFSRTPFGVVVKKMHDQGDPDEECKAGNIEGFKLNEREIEIIRMIADGKNNKEIASALCLSLGRTKNIISEILGKLGLNDRNQLASFAFKNKLI